MNTYTKVRLAYNAITAVTNDPITTQLPNVSSKLMAPLTTIYLVYSTRQQPSSAKTYGSLTVLNRIKDTTNLIKANVNASYSKS
ncbi:unnamed protein product [Ambrosiozyma monospora]|uniref:Unnamed protein product n=1 Tax=Ambrosiozyma monospora TaxID=43982 RepID=A0A9W6WJE5_AMBMO|nr:unnamed protein product [Ambrosiozyma monospora]